MAFTHNLSKAAYRHREAADELYARHRKDVAGYLYGIAAECAIKQMVIDLVLSPEHDKKAILFAHFPELRTLLRDALSGRNTKPLSVFIGSDAFMNNWEITMRYADAQQIHDHWVDAWKRQAHDVVNAMGT